MRPAFSSTKQAAAFALLLLVVLLSPVLAGKRFLPPREEAYAVRSWGCGPYPWIENQIFQETNDIDIAFLGSSHMLKAVDPVYVQKQLDQKLGKPTVVRTIAWGGAGYDGLYFIAKDLLEHRKIKMLVFYDEVDSVRNAAIVSLFRLGDRPPILDKLPVRDRGYYYGAALFGLPRNLLGLLRPDLAAEMHAGRPGYIQPLDNSFANAPEHLGAVPTRLGFNSSSKFADYAPFVPFQIPVIPPDLNAVVFSSGQETNFAFTKSALPAWELFFVRQFVLQCQAHDCRVVMLHIPTFGETALPVIQERAFWPDLLQADVAMIGVPPRKLFAGLTEAEIKLLYSDHGHFSQNGMALFTAVITPAVLHCYESSIRALTNHPE